MRQNALLLLTCCVALTAAACGNSATSGGGGGTDGGDTSNSDGVIGTDGVSNDVLGADGSKNDSAAADADAKDAAGTDATGGTDAAGTDATGGTDGIDQDVQPDQTDIADVADVQDVAPIDADDVNISDDATVTDVNMPDVPVLAPGACLTDTDCLGLNFSPCLIGYCDAGSQMCKVKSAADGVACATSGSCGGPGVCQGGGCNAPSTCQPGVCSPQQLTCGSKLTVDLSTLGASAFNGYGNCDSSKWDGPEFAILIQTDVTMTASLALDSTGLTADVEMFDIAPTSDGMCDTAGCDASDFFSMTIGAPANLPRIVFIDTSAATTGSVTLTLECTVTVLCGDGNCDPGETCGGCMKDCGKCNTGTCGDGVCAATEDCLLCPGDCGVCDAGCTSGSAPKCAGCSCESCVCTGPQPNYPNGDTFCCDTAWDSNCVSECKGCGAKCPSVLSTCGDGTCDWGTEDSTTCPNDCSNSYCGDGICSVADQETCGGCPIDCGFCLTVGPGGVGCGDGTCTGNENCTNCQADCGACGDYSCACQADGTCCNGDFGSACQDACKACIGANGGGSCPISSCGDGVCAGETCATCDIDCGTCPAYCGDGNCDPGEDKASCPKDCTPGCMASDVPTCNGCACESCVCANDSFCCTDAWDSACASECKLDCGMACP